MTWGGAAVARVTHNHKVAGSSPAPTISLTILDGPVILVRKGRPIQRGAVGSSGASVPCGGQVSGDQQWSPGQITFNGVIPCSS